MEIVNKKTGEKMVRTNNVSDVWGPMMRLIHNGTSVKVIECIVCGERASWCGRYPMTETVRRFISYHYDLHNDDVEYCGKDVSTIVSKIRGE